MGKIKELFSPLTKFLQIRKYLVFFVVLLSTFIAYNLSSNWEKALAGERLNGLPEPRKDSAGKERKGLPNKEQDTNFVDKAGKSRESDYSHSDLNFCGSGWQGRYASLHKSILSSKQDRRYLVYTCPGTQQGCCGYGNRVRALVSLFYLAVLTDRAFLIDWLVPEPIENHLKPNQIQWNHSAPLDISWKYTSRSHYWGTAGADKKRAEGWIIQDSKHFRNWFVSTNLIRYFDQPVEKITTIWYFVNGGIDSNPHLMNRAKQLGITPLLSPGPKYGAVRCAFDFLFQRSNLVESHLKQWRSLLKKSKGPTIGIHIRTGDKQFNYNSQWDDRSFNLQSRSKLEEFFRCAKHIEQTVFKEAKSSDTRWFLASDHIKVKQFATKYFPGKVITTNLSIQHLDVLYNVKNYNIKFHKNIKHVKIRRTKQQITQGIIGMLVDHFILSECDFLIVCDSSFSSTAIGLGMKDTDSFVFGDRHCLDYQKAKQVKKLTFY